MSKGRCVIAVYIELTTSPFDDSFARAVQGRGAGKDRVRRPFRGFEVKEDTFAYISLIKQDGTKVQLIDSSSETGRSDEYSGFILQSVQDSRMEKQQLIETFGSAYLMLFGEAPHFLNVSAMVFNSFDFNWKAEFIANYDQYLRGTRSIELGARTYMFYDTVIVGGYILNASVQETSNDNILVPISFQFFVTDYQDISIGMSNGDFPIRSSIVLPEGLNLREEFNGEQVDLLLQQGGRLEGGFSTGVQLSKPLRSKIADNADEFTGGVTKQAGLLTDNQLASTGRTGMSLGDLMQDVDSLSSSIGSLIADFGADPLAAFSAATADVLGYGVTFGAEGGVGIGFGASSGGGATFGASSGAGFNAGGFAGGAAGFGGRSGGGFGSNSYAGVGASAGAGYFAGGGGSYGAGYSAGYSLGAGGFAGGSSYSESGYGVFGAAQGAYQSSYGNQSRAQAAVAGGYAGANSSLGAFGAGGFAVGASAPGTGGGGSVPVGGDVSAFGFGAFSGTLGSGEHQERGWSFSKGGTLFP